MPTINWASSIDECFTIDDQCNRQSSIYDRTSRLEPIAISQLYPHKFGSCKQYRWKGDVVEYSTRSALGPSTVVYFWNKNDKEVLQQWWDDKLNYGNIPLQTILRSRDIIRLTSNGSNLAWTPAKYNARNFFCLTNGDAISPPDN